MQILLRATALVLAVSLASCSKDKHEHDHDHDHEEGHVHAPLIDGGALIELGDHEANLEVHFHQADGKLEIYLVDAHATDYVRSKQTTLAVTIEPHEGEPFALTLNQEASALSGETVGDSAKYSVTDERLKAMDHVHGKVASVSMQGATYPDVSFEWPAGAHDH